MPRRVNTRTYTPVERQKSVDAGRERIVAAARQLLEDDDAEAFSVDAVARRAGVSRMTIYNQFESKAGLLEALLDSLAVRRTARRDECRVRADRSSRRARRVHCAVRTLLDLQSSRARTSRGRGGVGLGARSRNGVGTNAGAPDYPNW